MITLPEGKLKKTQKASKNVHLLLTNGMDKEGGKDGAC